VFNKEASKNSFESDSDGTKSPTSLKKSSDGSDSSSDDGTQSLTSLENSSDSSDSSSEDNSVNSNNVGVKPGNLIAINLSAIFI
jgi:hypothetical protein